MEINTPDRFRMLAGSTGASSYTSIYITTTIILMFIYRGYNVTRAYILPTEYYLTNSLPTTVHILLFGCRRILQRTYFIRMSWYAADSTVTASDRHTSTVTSSTVDGADALHWCVIKRAMFVCIFRKHTFLA